MAMRRFLAISSRRPGSRRSRRNSSSTIPAPNLPGLASNFSVAVPNTASYNQTVDRIDQNIGDKIRLNVRAHWQKWDAFGGNAIPVNGTITPTQVTNYVFGYVHTLTPNVVNDFRVGRNFFDTYTINPFAAAKNTTAGTDLGIPNFDGDSKYNNPGIPDFNITGFNGFGSAGTNWYQNDSTHQISEQISWSRGTHNIMAGAEFRRLATGRAAVNSARGTFTFNGTQSGYAPADFILGHPVSFATAGPEIRGRVAGWRDGFFVLDKWQVSRKLTLNYGIRYELPTVPYTINGVASILNADQSALIVATPGFKFIAPQHKNWAPRLGFAYRINDKTVFRGGGGIYYNPNQTNSYTFLNTNPPWSPIFQCNWSSGLPTLSLSNPLGVPAACPLPGSNSGALIVTPPAEQPAGRMNQWSASLDRQLWSGGGLEVQYLGSHSYHLDRSFYNNTPLLPGPGAVNCAAAESEVWSHSHHRQRRNRQLREHERHFPAQPAQPAYAGQLHLVAHAGCLHGFQWRRRADESILVEGRLRKLQLGHPPPRGGHVCL